MVLRSPRRFQKAAQPVGVLGGPLFVEDVSEHRHTTRGAHCLGGILDREQPAISLRFERAAKFQ